MTPARPVTGGRLRVEWSPGSDRLTGICHCGAQHTAEDPAGIWTWLLSHPDHPPAGPGVPDRPHGSS